MCCPPLLIHNLRPPIFTTNTWKIRPVKSKKCGGNPETVGRPNPAPKTKNESMFILDLLFSIVSENVTSFFLYFQTQNQMNQRLLLSFPPVWHGFNPIICRRYTTLFFCTAPPHICTSTITTTMNMNILLILHNKMDIDASTTAMQRCPFFSSNNHTVPSKLPHM